MRAQLPEKRGLTGRIRFSQRCWVGFEIITPTPRHLVILNPASRFPKRFHNCISSLWKDLHFWEFCHHISVYFRVVYNSYLVKLSSFLRRSINKTIMSRLLQSNVHFQKCRTRNWHIFRTNREHSGSSNFLVGKKNDNYPFAKIIYTEINPSNNLSFAREPRSCDHPDSDILSLP